MKYSKHRCQKHESKISSASYSTSWSISIVVEGFDLGFGIPYKVLTNKHEKLGVYAW
jgi:hypothetical protein